MAAGCAVVATAVGGVPDLVTDGVHGRLAAMDDAAGIAAATVALLRDPARRRALGAAGRERALARHGAARLVAEIDRLYEAELAGARRRQGAPVGYAGESAPPARAS